MKYLLALAAVLPLAAQVDVGSGAPGEAMKLRFRQAFVRNAFDTSCSLPPLADVKKFGPTGLFQEFQDTAKTPNTRLALVKADTTDLVPDGTIDVFQVRAAMYAFYTASGVNTIGYPTMDTAACPIMSNNSCTWQTFDRSFALFAFTTPNVNGSNFQTREPFYTKWVSVGGVDTIGAAIESDGAATVASGVTSSRQTFTNGALYSITSGQNTGRVLAVLQPIYAVYAANGGHASALGLPVGEEQILVGGRRRQSFEGGSIEYDAGATPVIRPPAASVAIQPSSATIRLNLGETRTLTAHVLAANGAELDARTVLWTTSDSRVVALQATGATVVVRGAAAGSARVSAISEGKASLPVQVFVTAPCCEVGEGAPTAAIRQTFVDAVTRNRLALSLPGPAPVRRVGAGYAQELLTSDSQRVLIAKSDRAGAAFAVTGATLGRHTQLGGLAGVIGYPSADYDAAGRQLFDGGALAGSPVMRVTGAILARWAATAYERGPSGLPRGEAEPFLTFRATAGMSQAFTGGVAYAPSTGPLAGRAFLVNSGLILAKYLALGGAAGKYGMPVGDEESNAGRQRQDFEGGIISYVNGDTEASASEIDRRPEVTATPSPVLAGGRVRLAVGGFDSGATLRVAVTGQPEFIVKTQTGSHVWEVFVPASAASSTVAIRATDGTGVAQGLYRVVAREDAVIILARLQGDAQTGVPGGRLPLTLRVVLRDEFGNPIAGEPVRFNAVPGAAIEGASAATDERGEAQAWLRLPLTEGIVVATAQAAGQVVSFNARSAASTIENFPRFAHQDALAGAAAAVVRHSQNLGQLPQPFGPADPVLLEQFLRGFCIPSANGGQVCDGFVTPPEGATALLNPWRVGAFAGNGIDVAVEDPQPHTIRDWIALGSPVILALDLSAGAHFVVAIGVGTEGAIEILDPSTRFARTTLEQYLAGFTLSGREWKGALVAAIRLVARAPSVSGFLVVGGAAGFEVHSAAGACGRTVSWPNALAPVEPLPTAPGVARFRYCDGTEAAYQLDVAAPGARNQSLTDLANPGLVSTMPAAGPLSFLLTRATLWTVSPLEMSFAAASVVNAASLTPELAPGSLAAAFGQGFTAGTTVEVGGQAATVVSVTAFRVNFVIPGDLAPGTHPVRIRSAIGESEQMVEIRDVAPALFLPAGGQAVVFNQNGTANGPSNPAARTSVIVVFATGLGSVVAQGAVEASAVPVRGLLEGEELETLFAGATPGYPGLYQVNLRLPANLAPGIGLRLRLRQGGVESNATPVSVQ